MTMLAAGVDYTNVSLLQALILGGLGYVVVFFGLILLMVVVILMGKAFQAKKKVPKEEPAPAPVAAAPAAPAQPDAPGTAGQLKLYNTPPKTAAMLMAIVADKMGKPLNELRFISIKEVE